MKTDLNEIDKQLRVNTNFDTLLRAIDKCFSLCCNYPKGKGEAFKAWVEDYHPGCFLMSILRTSGSRQDLTVEGAGAVYMNRPYYMGYLNMALSGGDENAQNILLNNLFIVMSLLEMVAATCVLAIFYSSICLPMQFLAGKTHQLRGCN